MKATKFSLCAMLLAAMTLISACNCAKSPKTEHVILIGLDGMASASFNRAEMPNVSALMDQGCWTLAKRSTFPSSSAVNWASMFMGAGTELHGYTTWGSATPELPSRVLNEHGIFPTIYSILREQRPEAEIGCIYEWENIKNLVDSLSLSYFEGAGEGYYEHPERLTDMAIKYITEKKPTLFSIVYDHPDHEGHGCGWDSEEYHAAMRFYDSEVGRILKAIEDAGIKDECTVIVTSDHGGIDHGHGGILPAEYDTPFIIAGKGIRKGGEFSESMMQFDVAATIAGLFALEQPQVWIGRPMSCCFE